MALVDWTQQQKEEFLHMQFNAQHSYYHEHFCDAQFDIIESDSKTRNKESENNKPMGRLYVDRRVDDIRIIDIALLPEYRGKGIGEELMQSLIEEATGGKKTVSIHVEQNNPAMHLYQRLGFKRVRDEGVYYFMEWSAQEAEHTDSDQENTAS